MFKLIVIFNWIVVGLLTLLVGAETLFPTKGGDAAGRGIGQAIYYLAIIALVVLLILNLVPHRLGKYIAFGLVCVPLLYLQVAGPTRKFFRNLKAEINAKPPFPDRERNRVAEALYQGRPDKLQERLSEIPADSLRDPAYSFELFEIAAKGAGWSERRDQRIECLRTLLRAGVPMTPPSPEQAPVHVGVASTGQTDLLKLLLELGADPNALNYNYSTGARTVPMIFESMDISGSAYENVRLLLEYGASANAIKPAGSEPEQSVLFFAAERGRWDICRLLLEHGADPNAPASRKTELRQLVHDADPQNLDSACTPADLELVRRAVEGGELR